jgi:hypothetical protein
MAAISLSKQTRATLIITALVLGNICALFTLYILFL